MEIINTFLYEKGRVYIPGRLRKIFKAEGGYSKLCRRITMQAGEDVYYKWIVENTQVRMPKVYSDYYKKRGWKKLAIIGKVETTHFAKGRWRFLMIYSSLMHMEVDLHSFIDHEGVPLLVLSEGIITKLDSAGKITIPKDYRAHAYMDYLPENKLDYVQKNVLITVRKDFAMGIWHPHMWKTAPRIIKRLFD